MDSRKMRPHRLGIAISPILVVTTLSSVLLRAWVEMGRGESRKQRAAVEALEGRHGTVEYDDRYYRVSSGPRWRSPYFLYATPWWNSRRWLAVATGREREFATVDEVHFRAGVGAMSDAEWDYFCGAFASARDVRVYCPIKDGQLRYFARMRDLQYLEIAVTDEIPSVTGEGFLHLTGLRQLRWLTLRRIHLNAAGKKAVGKLESLKYLDILDHADDQTLANISNLKRLEQLTLTGGNITSEGLSHMRMMRSLRGLDLMNTRVGDEALRHLAGLKITELRLRWADVTDLGIRYIAPMPELAELDLRDTGITDKAIPDLEKLKKLRFLWLGGTQVTVGGCKELVAALPNQLSLQTPNGDYLSAPNTESKTHETRPKSAGGQMEARKR